MLDRLSQTTLARISENIPEELKSKLMKRVVNINQEELAKYTLKQRFIADYKKKKIQQLLSAGKLKYEEEIVDQDVADEIQKFQTIEIAKAKAYGILQDPLTDPFFFARMRRMAMLRIYGGDSRPLSATEKLQAAKLLKR